MTDPVAVAAPTTSTIVAALASSLLPFAGPVGVEMSALVPAVQQLYSAIMSHGDTTFTMEDLVKIIMQDNTATLAKLTADVNAMP